MEKSENRQNAEMFQSLSEKDGKFLSPVDLLIDKAQPLKLPKLVWQNVSFQPVKMKLTNTGHTVILSGKWSRQRPHITGGPLLSNYVFSQLHFHWGANEREGSEHTTNGISYPMEMHVVFFKSVYLTQEAALKEDDGVVVLAYLFKVVAKPNPSIDIVTSYLSQISGARTSVHIQPVPLSFFVDEFTDDYLTYWGGVQTHSCMHTILWIICRQALGVSMEQLAAFRQLEDSRSFKVTGNFREVHALDSRLVYHVNPSSNVSQLLFPVISQTRKQTNPVTVNYNYANVFNLRKHFPPLKTLKAERSHSKQFVNNFIHTDKLIFMDGTDEDRNILRILSQQLKKEVKDLDLERLDGIVNSQNFEENKRVKSFLGNQKKDIRENNVMQLEQAIKDSNKDKTDKSVKKFDNGDSDFLDINNVSNEETKYEAQPETRETDTSKQNNKDEEVITLYSNYALNNISYRTRICNTSTYVYKTRSERIRIAKERKLFENKRRSKHLEERRQKIANYNKILNKKVKVRNFCKNININTCSVNECTEVGGKIFDKHETLVCNRNPIHKKIVAKFEEVRSDKIKNETNLTANERYLSHIGEVLNDFKKNQRQQNEGQNESCFGLTDNILEENDSKLYSYNLLKINDVGERKEFVSSNEEKVNRKSRSDSMIKLKTDNRFSNVEEQCFQTDNSCKTDTPGQRNVSKKVISLKNVNKYDTNYVPDKSTLKITGNKKKVDKNCYEDDNINTGSSSIERYRKFKELESLKNLKKKHRSDSSIKFNDRDKIVNGCDESDSNNSTSSSVARYRAFIKHELLRHISNTVKEGTFDDGRSNSSTTLNKGKNGICGRSGSATRYREFIKQELMRGVKQIYEENYLFCMTKSKYQTKSTSKNIEESSGTFRSIAIESMVNQLRQDKAEKLKNQETTSGYMSNTSRSNSPVTVVTGSKKVQRSDKKYEDNSCISNRRSRSLFRQGMGKESLIRNVVVQSKENRTSEKSAKNKKVTKMDDKYEGTNGVNRSSMCRDTYGRKTLMKRLGETTTKDYTSGESRSNSPMKRNIHNENNRSKSRSPTCVSTIKKELIEDTTERYASGESRSNSPKTFDKNRNIRYTHEENYNNRKCISPIRYNKIVSREHTEKRSSGERTLTADIAKNKTAIKVDINYGENSNIKSKSSERIENKEFSKSASTKVPIRSNSPTTHTTRNRKVAVKKCEGNVDNNKSKSSDIRRKAFVPENCTSSESRSNLPDTFNTINKMVDENDDRFDCDLLRQKRTEFLNSTSKTSRAISNNESGRLLDENLASTEPIDIIANKCAGSKNVGEIKHLVDVGMQVDRGTASSLDVKPGQIESDLEAFVEKYSPVEKNTFKRTDGYAESCAVTSVTDADKRKVNFNNEDQRAPETLNRRLPNSVKQCDDTEKPDLNTIIGKQIAEHPMFQIFNNIASKVFSEANNQGGRIEEGNVEDLLLEYILRKRTHLEIQSDKISETDGGKNQGNKVKIKSEDVEDTNKGTKVENKVVEVDVKGKMDGNVKLESSAMISAQQERVNNLSNDTELVIQTNNKVPQIYGTEHFVHNPTEHTEDYESDFVDIQIVPECNDLSSGDENVEEIICNQAVNRTYETNSTTGQEYVRNDSTLSQTTQYCGSKRTDGKSTGRAGNYSGNVIQESEFTEKIRSNSSRPSSEKLYDKKSEEINLMIRKTIRHKSLSPKRKMDSYESDLSEFTYSTTQEYKAKVVSTFENSKGMNQVVTDSKYFRSRSSSPRKLYEMCSNESLEDPSTDFIMDDVALKSPVGPSTRSVSPNCFLLQTNPNDLREGKCTAKSEKRSVFTSTTRNKHRENLSSSDVSSKDEYRYVATPIAFEVKFAVDKTDKIDDYIKTNREYGRVTSSSNISTTDALKVSSLGCPSSTHLGGNKLDSSNITEEKTTVAIPLEKNGNELELKKSKENSINWHDKLKTKIPGSKIKNNKNEVSKEKLKNGGSNVLKTKVNKNIQDVRKLETTVEVNGSSVLDSQRSGNPIKRNKSPISDLQGNYEGTGSSKPIISAQANNKPVKSKRTEKPIVKENKKPKFEFLKRQSKTFKPDNSFIKKIKNKDLLKNKFSYQVETRICTASQVDDVPKSKVDKKKFDYLKSRSKSANVKVKAATMPRNRSMSPKTKITELKAIDKREQHSRNSKGELAPIQLITFEPHEVNKGNFKKIVYQPKKKVILKPNVLRRLKQLDDNAKIHQRPTIGFNSTRKKQSKSPDPNQYYSNQSDNYGQLTDSSRLECENGSVCRTRNASSVECQSKIPRWKP